MRNPAAVERKIRRAWIPLEKVFDNVVYDIHYSSKWGNHEVHILFDYQGMRYRWDWEMDYLDDLPKVADIRNLVWESLHEYRANPVNLHKHPKVL